MTIPRTNNFDLIRLLAAVQVVLGHAVILSPENNAPIAYLMQILEYFPGVPVFFTVSGFLIFWSYDRNSDNIGQFFRNRFLRIYPALWVCFAVTIALLLLFQEISLATFGMVDFWGWVLRQVTFFQFGTPEILRHWGDGQVNRSLWTISVELQYYFLLPFMYYFLKLFGKRWVIGYWALFVTSIGVYVLVDKLPAENFVRRLAPLCVISYLFNFLIGVAFYRWWDRLRIFVENRFMYWLVAYGVFAAIFGELLGWYHVWPYSPEPVRMLGYLLLSILTISLAFSFPTISKRMIKGFDISYGLYIYHGLVLNCMLSFGWVSNWSPLIMLTISCVVGSLSWVLVERPVLRLKKKPATDVTPATQEEKNSVADGSTL